MHSRTLIALDTGLGLPVAGKGFDEIITRGQVLSISTSTGKTDVVSESAEYLALPDGVVYSKQLEQLFVTNMGVPPVNDGGVISMRADGSGLQVVLHKGQVHTPKQIALDSVNNKLYISDREGMRILRCDIDGSGLETLIETGKLDEVHDQTRWCVGIAVSPKTGLFYWTQKGPSKGGQGRIFCAPIEVSGKREPTCLLDDLPEPIDLDIHEATNTLYWTDRGELPYGNTFNRIRLNGKGSALAQEEKDPRTGLRHEILAQNLNEAIGLAYDEESDRWLLSDMGGTISSFDRDGGDRKVIVECKERAFTGIALI